MKQWTKLMELPVIEQDSGKVIGKVLQVWLHAGGQQVQGVSIKAGGLRTRRLYASMDHIALIGDISILVSRTSAQSDSKEAIGLRRDTRVSGIDGEQIGWLTDAMIDETTGIVSALEVSRGYIDEFQHGREWVREFTIRPCGVIAVMRVPE